MNENTIMQAANHLLSTNDFLLSDKCSVEGVYGLAIFMFLLSYNNQAHPTKTA